MDRLTNLIGIFQKPELDFSKNRADNDDILGDAYEYLMRHFATESGRFYTPSEVSRVIAKVIGISSRNAVASTTAYDPTCGSGSLLLKVAAEAGKHITLEGQEKDVTTAGLARMNMILHDFPTANILSGNTLAAPKFKDGEQLRTYDYVVANPPFSDKTWSTGLMAPIGNHSFRATGITAYLANDGTLEHAQAMVAHESPRTTKLYDRSKERLTLDEIERIVIYCKSMNMDITKFARRGGIARTKKLPRKRRREIATLASLATLCKLCRLDRLIGIAPGACC